MREYENKNVLTTNEGAPIMNNQNSLTVGDRGPVLLQDIQLIEKFAQFDRERIPERVVHAKGAGAHGYFQVYKLMKNYTIARFLQNPDEKTPVFVRFSTVIGSKGSADTARDPRGFAVKFYTKDGNYDLAGNDIPVFFIRDGMKFPDLIHALKPAPDTNIIDQNRVWDFFSSMPETTHMITWVYSDRGTIKSYRRIEGFGVNTFVWVNDKGERRFVKYHWKPALGVETIDRKEAEFLAGADPDIATRDLYDTLKKGETVEYELLVQLMSTKEDCTLDFDPLDATKFWPEDKFPLMKVGRLILDRAPENFFAEVEQVAFCPSNLVPGIEMSADKMLQGRLFAYRDTQRYRVGTNFAQLPINRPKCPVNNNIQDGSMRYFAKSGTVNYDPNTLDDGNPKEAKGMIMPTEYVSGKIERKTIPNTEDFKQAGDRYRAMTDIEKEHLVDNIANDLWQANEEIQIRAIGNFTKACPEFGKRVAKALKIADYE